MARKGPLENVSLGWGGGEIGGEDEGWGGEKSLYPCTVYIHKYMCA